MKSTWLSILIVLQILSSAQGQETFVKKIYYDDEETRLKEFITLRKKDSVPNGLYQSIFENGSLAIKGYYSNGKSDSTWVYYFENGKKKARGKYRLGRQFGKWKYFFESGQLKHEGAFAENQKHGFWKYYYESGSEKSTGMYFHDKKGGIWNYFFEDGTLKAQAYFEDHKGTYKGFYPSGKLKSEGQNVNEKSEGLWAYYYETGEKEAEGNYRNGLRDGDWTFFHKNGKISAVGAYEAGEKTGTWRYFHADGSLSSEGKMVENQKDGYWKLFYIGGELKGEGHYDQGSGLYVEYYPSGKQKARGKLRNGLKHGKWIYFNEEGLENGVATFTDGVGNYTGYYSDGTLKMKGRLEGDKRVGTWTLYNPDGSVAGTYTPVYEEEKPIFRTSDKEKRVAEKRNAEKPEYHYKNKKLRYFDPRINEYTGYIIGTNPAWTAVGRLPVAVEYYIQERLGHEVQITFHNKPFFTNHVDVAANNIYKYGADITLRQKFYHQDKALGMFYFGHQLSGGFLEHKANYLDSTFISIAPIQRTRSSHETRFSYGIFIGSRWMRQPGNSGVTIDFNVGLGIGTRSYHLQESEDPQSDVLFDELNGDEIYLPIIFTLNVGFAGPKRRSTSY